MSVFSVAIEMNNDAFEEGSVELARLLRVIAHRVEEGETDGTVMDLNGNTAGAFATMKGSQ